MGAAARADAPPPARLTVSVVGGLFWQLGGVVTPVVLGWIVDRGIEGDDRQVVWVGAVALVAIGAVEAVAPASPVRLPGVHRRLRRPPRRPHRRRAAPRRRRSAPLSTRRDRTARETSDTSAIADLLDAFGQTVATAVSLPIVLVILAVIDPVLGLVVGALVPLSLVLTFRSSLVWERRSTAARNAMGATVQFAQETVEHGKALRGVGAEAATVDRFAGESAELRRRSVRLADLWIVFEPLLESLSLLSVALVMWIGGVRVIDGGMPVGDVVTAVGLVLFLSGPVRTVGSRVLTVQSALASAARVAQVLDSGVAARHPHRPPRRGHDGPGAVGSGLVVGRRGGDQPLARAELDLWPGSLTVLAGATGSGKSTVLAALAGIRDSLAGGVTIGGAPMDAWPRTALRERVLLLGPAPFLFAGTVRENLRFAAPGAAEAALRAALTAARCGFVDDLPEGLDSTIGERGVDLSGGQRQRIAVARAILAAPDVLLFDGATSALDPDTEIQVVAQVRTVLPAAAVVVVSDNPGVIELADARWSLRDGELVNA